MFNCGSSTFEEKGSFFGSRIRIFEIAPERKSRFRVREFVNFEKERRESLDLEVKRNIKQGSIID